MKYIERYDGDSREIKHCCDVMKKNVLDYRLMIDYDTEDKEYFIQRVYPYTDRHTLWYCPWCAKKLDTL